MNQLVKGKKSFTNSALFSYNDYVLLRRLRIQSVTKGVAVMIWWVVFFGALINLVLSWLFVVKNKSLHILMNGLLGALIGALIFLIIVLGLPVSRMVQSKFRFLRNYLSAADEMSQ